ncbi:BTAD domain-containing putative transcriptional regulator [Occultella aeris]|uniref:Bacterial transcriptional activator domain protein n=1 Tax=Occultella aeris TaxID=2761496 RepID=A0A7M4DGN0_9MICO|nr:BTAD domain-containing putative transcriptional regulator [Occultella aeris]VZO36073.1 Bacterial transcriptional activator domain protein [Occultella aeris]
MTALTVRLLGPFRALRGDRPLPSPMLHKAQDLLTMLFLAPGHALLRESAAESLWPDTDAETSRKAMRQTLWQIHHATEEPMAQDRLVICDGDGLMINPERPVSVDLPVFVGAVREAQDTGGRVLTDDRLIRLCTAADLYRGPLHAGCYDDWCLIPRARLEDRCLTLLDRISRERERRGDLDGAIAWTQRLLEIEPAHERSHRRLMRLFSRVGDRTGALRQLAECRAALARDLGVHPEASTEDLGAAILADRMDHDSGRAPLAGAGIPDADTELTLLRLEVAALRQSIECIGEQLRDAPVPTSGADLGVVPPLTSHQPGPGW